MRSAARTLDAQTTILVLKVPEATRR